MLNTSAAAAEPHSLTDVFSGLAGCTRVAVAVSGGSDSMALLLLARDWAAREGIQLVALTIDHGLRAASADEALQVAQWCAAMGIPHHILPWVGVKPVTGIQAAARLARYDVMSAWCKAHDFDVLLTGHTMDDQAETVAMRLSRTRSARSLSAIWPDMRWQGVRVVRPLLFLQRQDLRDVLRSRGQPWIDDPSNEDDRFERVRVRKVMSTGDVAALARVAQDAQIVTAAHARASAAFFSSSVHVDADGCVQIDRKAFSGLETAIASDVLARAVHLAGAGLWPLRAGIATLTEWIVANGLGRRTLAGAVVALRQRHIVVAREAGRIVQAWVPATDGMIWDGRFEISVPQGAILVGPARLAKALARPPATPVYVWDGLPAVKLTNGAVILAQEAEKFAISAIFRERFCF
jgi:tRNA(Ile)-lysidine synthase